MPIAVSNISHCIDKKGTISKVGFKIKDGQKNRFYKKTGTFF